MQQLVTLKVWATDLKSRISTRGQNFLEITTFIGGQPHKLVVFLIPRADRVLSLRTCCISTITTVKTTNRLLYEHADLQEKKKENWIRFAFGLSHALQSIHAMHLQTPTPIWKTGAIASNRGHWALAVQVTKSLILSVHSDKEYLQIDQKREMFKTFRLRSSLIRLNRQVSGLFYQLLP